MNSLILRALAPALVAVMLIFSVFVLLRGHNEPGGGFIGGLIAAAAIAILGIAQGPLAARRALRIDPMALAGFGVLIAALSGFLSYFYDVPYLTGLWTVFAIDNAEVAISTPLVFDIGVYCVVFGTVSALALALEAESGEAE